MISPPEPADAGNSDGQLITFFFFILIFI